MFRYDLIHHVKVLQYFVMIILHVFQTKRFSPWKNAWSKSNTFPVCVCVYFNIVLLLFSLSFWFNLILILLLFIIIVGIWHMIDSQVCKSLLTLDFNGSFAIKAVTSVCITFEQKNTFYFILVSLIKHP